jgi:D-2-hydroxyacid dehydrogenase (NADP+)
LKIVSSRPWKKWQKEAIAKVVHDVIFLEKDLDGPLEELVFQADVLFGSTHIDPKLLAESKTLKLMHVQSTGVDRYMVPEFIESDIILINSKGVHAGPVADHAMAMLLALSQDFQNAYANQSKRLWIDLSPTRLEGKTVGLLGLGAIGQALAKRCKAFDLKVLGIRRNPDSSVEFVDQVFSIDSVDKVLAESDFVISSLPLTKETHHFLSKREFSLMKSSSFFINVGRGPVVNEEDLIEALRKGEIKGAGLDVFEEEPLDAQSPLWEMPNVLITPHSAGNDPDNWRKTMDIFVENLRRWQEGKPLINVVDKKRGY